MQFLQRTMIFETCGLLKRILHVFVFQAELSDHPEHTGRRELNKMTED